MATQYSATFKLFLEIAAKAGTAIQGNTPSWQGTISVLEKLLQGTTAGAFDLAYLGERTIASNTNDDIDLAGVLTDALGQVLTMAELVGLVVVNAPRLDTDAANTTNLVIGVGSNPVVGFLGGTTPTIGPIRPGGSFSLWCGANAAGIGAVAGGSADILRINNSAGAAAKVQVAVLGRSS